MKLSEIKKNPHNPRIIRDEKFERLKKSIKEFPQMMTLRPIVVDESGVVLGGNMRLEALKALGKREIPDEWVKRADELTPEQKQEFIIKDNAGFGEWDWDLLANEWSDLPLSDWGVDIPEDWAPVETVEDDESAVAEMLDLAAELQEKWKVKKGDLWEVGNHRLLCGDSTNAKDVSRLMAGDKAECVFTSPPYAVGIDYGTYEDTIDNLRKMLPLLAARWSEVLLPGGFAVTNFGDIVSASQIVGTKEPCEYPMALEYWPIFRAAGFVLWSRRIWCKPGAGTGSMQCIKQSGGDQLGTCLDVEGARQVLI